MALVNKPHDFGPGKLGQIISPDEVDNNFDVLYTTINGQLDDSNMAAFTADQTNAPTSSGPAKYGVFISWLTNRIKAITGQSDWWLSPVATISGIWSKFNSSTGHRHTGAADDAPQIQTNGIADGAVTAAKIASGAVVSHLGYTPWHPGNDGAGSGLDADVLDGMQPSTGAVAHTIVQRDANGRFQATDPASAQDVATKAYVDSVLQGLDVKQSVKVATTANITLSGLQTIDGISLSTGDRVLVKNQTNAAENGIYVANSGAWTRATDADTATKLTSGMFVFVEQGTVNKDSGWVLTTDGPVTLGTTSLTFVQFSGAGQITVGAGLTKTGNFIDVATSTVTPGTYKSVTVDSYGRVTSGTNPTTLVGYGITDAVNKAGDSMTGALTLGGATPALYLTNKYCLYYDGASSEFVIKVVNS